MTDNELKEIRQKISCPQLGDECYGEWGVLTKDQRFTIKRMLDYIAAQEEHINRQREEIDMLKEKLAQTDKALVVINKVYDELLAEVSRIESEAYKEFWNELKTYSRKMRANDFRGSAWDRVIFVEDGDNLLKEMEGAEYGK